MKRVTGTGGIFYRVAALHSLLDALSEPPAGQ